MLLGAIFKSITTPKPKPTSTAKFSSTKSAVGPSGYVSLDAIASAPKNSMMDDIKMDLGIKPKNAAYYRDLPKRRKRSQEAAKISSGGGSSTPKGPTAAELRAQRKAAALAERKRLGQVARKKFEKEKGERVAALRKKIATLLNVS
jgi:hypothetical protein